MNCYLGIDVGSVSTNAVLINKDYNVVKKVYIRTSGKPIEAVKKALDKIKQSNIKILGVGTTGSARQLAGAIVGADVIKNEITSHAVAASQEHQNVSTIIEIGGQDSKIIILRDGIVVDFAMNTVCAAGTGSFLEQQASRLNIPIEEFGKLALQAENPVRIAGRCSVFAESDMIHKQQLGHNIEDIIAGLSESLVKNYLNNLAQGKDITKPIIFQGGVAANIGIKKAFETELETEIIIPEHYNVMGALGSAILAKEKMLEKNKSSFRGFSAINFKYKARSFICDNCSNQCEIINIHCGDEIIARWGSKCPKWEAV